jgi:hypothetical protein
MAEVSLFAGPTAHGIERSALLPVGTQLLPPARRGDIDRLIESSEPGVVIVCDGVFQIAPAVSHAELCRALDGGWQVWGVSSIGAIRAHELRSEGMRGFGYVHAQFERFADFTDDEMCLLHFPEAPYFPVSEALVNLRYALERRHADLGISEAAQTRLISALRELWFGDRTEEKIRSLMLEHAGISQASTEALLDWLRRHRAKTIDLAELMALQPWLDPLKAAAPSAACRPSTSTHRPA